MTTWTRPPAGIDGTWCLLRDRRGRLHVAGEAVAAEFAEDGPPLATGTFDEMTDLAREHNRAKVQAVAGPPVCPVCGDSGLLTFDTPGAFCRAFCRACGSDVEVAP